MKGHSSQPRGSQRPEVAHRNRYNNGIRVEKRSGPKRVATEPEESEEPERGRAKGSKHKPKEISAKIPQKRIIPPSLESGGGLRINRRDPRFDSLSGIFNEDLHKQSYRFLKEYQRDEISSLKKTLSTIGDAEEKERLQNLYKSMTDRQKRAEDLMKQKDFLRKQKHTELEKVEHGKKPFYHKRKDIKNMIEENRYKDIKGTKRYQKILDRRERKKDQKAKKRGI